MLDGLPEKYASMIIAIEYSDIEINADAIKTDRSLQKLVSDIITTKKKSRSMFLMLFF